MAHRRAHSGDKPYSCAGCVTKFGLNGNLKTHAGQHVGGEEFQCHLCEKVYPHADNLRQHILSFHEVKDEEVMILLEGANPGLILGGETGLPEPGVQGPLSILTVGTVLKMPNRCS